MNKLVATLILLGFSYSSVADHHGQHAITQIPYALIALIIAIIGYIGLCYLQTKEGKG